MCTCAVKKGYAEHILFEWTNIVLTPPVQAEIYREEYPCNEKRTK